MAKRKKKPIRCPKCRSTNVALSDPGEKKFSMGKAIVGAAIGDLPGALVGGVVIGKRTEMEFICLDCRHRWEEK